MASTIHSYSQDAYRSFPHRVTVAATAVTAVVMVVEATEVVMAEVEAEVDGETTIK